MPARTAGNSSTSWPNWGLSIPKTRPRIAASVFDSVVEVLGYLSLSRAATRLARIRVKSSLTNLPPRSPSR